MTWFFGLFHKYNFEKYIYKYNKILSDKQPEKRLQIKKTLFVRNA